MKGEFRGDFSRDTFDPSKHFLRVLMQQGRVSLDADWNEQVDILLHYMQTLAKDIIGPYAGPEDKLGFEITKSGDSFNIGYGRYYVNGILCENYEQGNPCKKNDAQKSINYYSQPNGIRSSEINLFDDSKLLVYLDVWERHISFVEDDDIREKALGGPDTAARSKVIWQVKVLKSDESKWNNYLAQEDGNDENCEGVRTSWPAIVENCLQPLNRGCLKARARKPSENDDNPCNTPPEAKYRGAENQLYRVEIHRSGKAFGNGDEVATFKWSRENGTVVFPILNITGKTVVLEHLGRDDRLSLKVNDWVEIIDDDYTINIQSRPPLEELRSLAQVEKIDLTEMKVSLKRNVANLPDYEKIKDKHPLLRRWDYKEGDISKFDVHEFSDGAAFALPVKEGDCNIDDSWLTLEDGVQICFQMLSEEQDGYQEYQAGDYWLIPARTATGDVEWPGSVEEPEAIPPHGIDHHYAPLAIVGAGTTPPVDCRRVIKPSAENVQSSS